MLKRFHKSLSGLARLFNVDISNLVAIYRDVYYKRLNARGKHDAVAFMKQLLTCGERYALHQPIESLSWTRSDRDGFPKVISAFKPYLRGNRFQKIFALSVLRSVEALRLPISKDLSSVTDPPVYSEELVTEISSFIGKVPWAKPLELKPLKYHYTAKKGPNGPALEYSDSDVTALTKSPELLEAILVVQEKLGGSYPLEASFQSRSDAKAITSKLTQFPEKAGKTRTIAVIDYYSQRALKPLHEALMLRLRTLESDGTYSHRNVGTWAQECTDRKDYTYCADLSSATDRFPAPIQKALLSVLVPDPDLATAFWTLLAERTFTVAWSGERVRYQAGQPMGAYASWPLFSLAHHLVIEYCAGSLKGVSRKYRQIGDDFITSDQIQGQQYKTVMQRLGVTINDNKTVESLKGSEHSAAEVAKQLFLNGENLTPVTPGFVSDLVKPHMFNMCLAELRARYKPLPVTPAELINCLFYKESIRERVWLLSSNPWNGSIKPSDEGYDTSSPWASRDLSVFNLILHNLRLMNMTMKAEMIFSELLDSDEYGFQESPRQDSHPRNDAQLHCEEEIRAQVTDCMLKLNDYFADSEEAIQIIPIEYVPDPRDQYKSRKEQRCIQESYLVEQVLPELPPLSLET